MFSHFSVIVMRSARVLLGRALKLMNELQRAEDHLTLAIIQDSTDPTHFIERGDIRYRTGKKNKIIDAIYG